MKKRFCLQTPFIFLLAALFVTVTASAQTQTAPLITQAVDVSQRKALTGSVHPLAKQLTDLGRAEFSLPMKDMLLLLASPVSQASIDQAIADLHNPHSPNYHKWLTPAQYAARFGVADADVSTISAWLTSSGFQVEQVARGKNWIRFSGTAGQVENAFQTQIHRYSYQGATKYSNASGLSIPAALSPAVRGVVSMNNFFASPQHSQPQNIARNKDGKFVRANSNATQPPTSPNFTGGSGSQLVNFLSPADFSKIYDAQSVVASGIDGTGTSIAIVGRSDINMSDVESFRTIAGLPFNDPNIIYATTDPGIVADGDDVEASLDVEWAGAIAPEAKINFVVGASTSTTDGVDLAASYIVDNVTSPIMSVSFGLCEANMTDAEINFYHTLWQQAASEGITVFVAGGDAGASGCNNPEDESTTYGFGVSGLSSTPYNVAVGGTEFNDTYLNTYWNLNNTSQQESAKGYIPEAVWNESCAGNVSTSLTNCNFPPYYLYSYAGGGGASSCLTRTTDEYGDEYCAAGYAKPSWQTGPGVPQDGVRDVPDVSLAAAAEHDGFLFCYDGSCQWTTGSDGTLTLEQASIVGGTSAASPSMASIMALVEQKNGQFQGVANYQLYSLAAAEQGQSCDASKRTDPSQPTACVFNDITLGSNAVPCFSGNQDCQGQDQPVPIGQSLPPAIFPPDSFTDGQSATAGYDLASGLGSVDVANLVNSWSSVSAGTKASTTTLALSKTTFIHGTPITLDGTVAPASGTGTPTGEVLINSGSDSGITSIPLASGAFSGQSVNLPGGTYTVTAKYSGDTTYAPSTSSPVSVKIAPEKSTLVPTTFAYSRFLIFGQPRLLTTDTTQLGNTFYVQVQIQGASGSTAATGTIKLSENGKVYGTYPVGQQGYIYLTCGPETECDLPMGNHTLKADYSGDSSFNASSITFPFDVTQGTTYWSSSASIIEPVAGTKDVGYITFTGDPGNPPTGSVTLTRDDTGAVLGTGTIDKTGTATIPFIASSGSYNLDASYGGDANYQAGNQKEWQGIIAQDNGGANKLNLTLNLGTTSFSLGQQSQVTVSAVPASSTTKGTPIGFVTLYSALGQISGQLELSGGKASGIVEWDNVGAQSVYAVYGGDGNYAGASSSSIKVTVSQATPALIVQPLSGYVAVGGQTSVSALLTSPLSTTNVPAPTGTIQFFDFANGAAAQPIGTPQAISTGNGGTLLATLAPLLPTGSNVITAMYSGDANWKAVMSAAIPPIVVTTSDYTLSVPDSTVAVTAGETASVAVNTQSILGYNAPITLSCGGTLPQGVSCSSATVNPGAAGAITLTTTAPGTESQSASAQSRGTFWALSGSASLAGLFLLCLPDRRRYIQYIGAFLLVALISGVVGCGGGSAQPTAVSLTSSSSKVASGSSVRFTASIVSDHPLDGTVTFYDGTTAIGSPVTPVTGIASVSVNSLAVGTHAITAKYSGDNDNLGSQSSDVLEQTITGSFTLTIQAVSGTLSHTATVPAALQ
jgi:hypothetical protein